MTPDVKRQFDALIVTPSTVQYVAGPRMSGLTTALMQAATGWARGGFRVVYVTDDTDVHHTWRSMREVDPAGWQLVSLLAGPVAALATTIGRRAYGMRADVVLVDLPVHTPALFAALLGTFGDACFVFSIDTGTADRPDRPASDRSALSAIPPNA